MQHLGGASTGVKGTVDAFAEVLATAVGVEVDLTLSLSDYRPEIERDDGGEHGGCEGKEREEEGEGGGEGGSGSGEGHLHFSMRERDDERVGTKERSWDLMLEDGNLERKSSQQRRR